MARSRQRERELARRRYERRRMREQQQRARRRRRNTVLGAVAGTLAVIGGLVFLLLHFVGGDDNSKVDAKSSPSPSPSASASPTSTAAPTKCAPISPNPPAAGQPMVPPVVGKPPATLQIKDVKVGNGAVAKKGSSLAVSYIGIACSNGKVFDATYKDGGKPFTVSPLGSASVIAGWNQGLIGVRAGGVRELVIPPALGYGPNASGPIGPNETLIFLVTVESVK
ncbi:MAG: FKBP-type peptidyl-prolyl cis-trans isomerase FkpA [Frankiaceae bacterium]|nr:FKBP-type peptidyl-prolyl cis-trans isomerase FkpA [Frankiaceae bacterium]